MELGKLRQGTREKRYGLDGVGRSVPCILGSTQIHQPFHVYVFTKRMVIVAVNVSKGTYGNAGRCQGHSRCCVCARLASLALTPTVSILLSTPC